MEYLIERSTDTLHFFKENGKTISIEADTKELAEQIYNENHSTLVIAKKEKISEVKDQANDLIEKDYPKYKQINYALGLQVNGYDNATNKANMESYIKSIIEKSELMESEINALTTEQEVKDYQINFNV